MTLSEFGVKNRYTVYALFIAILIFGAVSYFSLPVQLFPDTAPPLVNILTSYPGAAAEDVADLVSDPIETEAAALEGVAAISSTSQNGLSLVTVEFRYGTSVDLAAVDVQNALSRIRSRLPREMADPQVLKFSTSARPILTMGLRGEDPAAVRRLAEDVFGPEIQRVPGVAVVDVFGGSRPEVSVLVDRSRLSAHRLPLAAVAEAIRAHNVGEPAGQIRGAGGHYAFRVDNRSGSPEDLGAIPITTPEGRRIRVADLAEIVSGGGEDASRFRVGGRPSIAMQVLKQEDANTVKTIDLALAKFDELRLRHPEVEFDLADEDGSFARQVVDNMLSSVAQALFLAAAIIFLFLGSFKRGLVTAVSMPMSFLLSFSLMKIFGFQIDMVTLTAIILAVGMVVDASVVILENISSAHGEKGLPPVDAAIQGAGEIQFSVIAGNLTTLIVLVPLLFLYGFIGKTFGPLAATLIIAFTSSLVVALVLVPILTIPALKDGRMEALARKLSRPWEKLMDALRRLLVDLLRRALDARLVVFAVALLSFAGGALLLRNLGMEMLPKMDGGASFIVIETPSGSTLEETEEVVARVEEAVAAEPELVRFSSQIGFEPGMHSFGGGGVQGPTQGYITVTWTPRTERKRSIWDIQEDLRGKITRIPDIKNFVVRESGSTAKATTAASIVVKLRGGDPLVLDKLGDVAMEKISTVTGVTNPYRSWRRDQTVFELAVDAERSREIGLDPRSLAREAASALDGVGAGILRSPGGETTPILVKYAPGFRRFQEDIYDVGVASRRDGTVLPLGALASAGRTTTQGLVTRENLLPTLEVLASHGSRPLNFVTRDVEKAIAGIRVPQGYAISVEGENRDMEEARKEIAGALLLSLAAVYLLLTAQFKSFLHPVTVMAAIPLSLAGVAAALAVAGKPMSMPVLVGLVLLVGIAVNNSIILIDFIQARRSQGASRREAILESVGARFRPIMMTSLSTIVGMIPLALETALGAERFSPLATAVLGGMTASTLLTMVVVPVLYDFFEDLRRAPKEGVSQG